MFKKNITTASPARFSPARESARWGAATDSQEHYQPQDGAMRLVERRGNVSEIGLRRKRMAGEPEDARLTGGTRSLMRRLSGLNIGLRRRPAKIGVAVVA